MNYKKIETTVDILFFAFRYALSRKTGMYMFVIPELEKHKKSFRQDELQQIINEIEDQNRLYDINQEWVNFANKWKNELKT